MNGACSALSFLTASQFVQTKDALSVFHWAKKQRLWWVCSHQLIPHPFQGTGGSLRRCSISGSKGQGYLPPGETPVTHAVVVRQGEGMWHSPHIPWSGVLVVGCWGVRSIPHHTLALMLPLCSPASGFLSLRPTPQHSLQPLQWNFPWNR